MGRVKLSQLELKSCHFRSVRAVFVLVVSLGVVGLICVLEGDCFLWHGLPSKGGWVGLG